MVETQEAVSEDEKVFVHRVHIFLGLGYPVEDAEVLAVSKISHHELAKLVRSGCPLELAPQILG
jgi:hypothetical protein